MDKQIESKIIDSTDVSAREQPRRPKPRKWWQFGGQDVSYVSVDADIDIGSETSSQESGNLAKNRNNVFEAPEATEIYKPIANFEGAHRFDPDATWEPEEEKRLVKRVRLANSCLCAFMVNQGSSSIG
jgi:hypothetical protein